MFEGIMSSVVNFPRIPMVFVSRCAKGHQKCPRSIYVGKIEHCIFLKKLAIGIPHELPNTKKLKIWINQKKTAPLLRKKRLKNKFFKDY